MSGQPDSGEKLVVLESATVVDPGGPHHGRCCTIVIRGGIIEETGSPAAGRRFRRATVIDASGVVVSPGWVDVLVLAGNWLERPAEAPVQVAECAVRGGFTHVVVAPSTLLDLSEPAVISGLKEVSRALPVDVSFWGQLGRGEGELAPLLSLVEAGVVGWASVAGAPPPDRLILLRACRYAVLLGKPMLLSMMVEQPVAHSFVHFCEEAEWWGLEGVLPSLEEALAEQFLRLCGEGVRVALCAPSFAYSFREVLGGGRGVSPRQPPYYVLLPVHLTLSCGRVARPADSRFAFLPPVREEEHRRELLALVGSERVVVASGHASVQVHERLCELDAVNPLGVGTLELTFSLVYSALVDAGVHPTEALERCIVSLAHNPRKLLDWQPLHIEEGAPATLTLVEPARRWTVSARRLATATADVLPWRGWTLYGRVAGVVNGGRVHLC